MSWVYFVKAKSNTLVLYHLAEVPTKLTKIKCTLILGISNAFIKQLEQLGIFHNKLHQTCLLHVSTLDFPTTFEKRKPKIGNQKKKTKNRSREWVVEATKTNKKTDSVHKRFVY
eukprot:Phypoly_transcript_19965.p1 GENE.Phypoly_transcript_19965~~Phypoly_transcript_19965.p1  ORF type:complete len:121 (+),score=14.43 Phypoly_transcript_19965:24-365(+)